ncbi:TadE/TadG family type IV pilus assembly protein [Chlorobaculum sp. 24CR]|uniref:TadE/TadG family type IV pilus assembly protein n=1 Tax=Chlorobaculum sp. 24CR TaxID=2508878 RepID=UPI001FD6E244|nr:TadE/TadG family type IV pilus assembly protein [Chlorobaculum sp. 24CR]
MRKNRAIKSPAKMLARSQKGNALVEFALVLPVFLTLVFGMVTFSLALYNKTVLTMATREGARAGAISSSAGIAETAATSASNNHLISFASGTTTPTINASISSGVITVNASFNYTGLPFLGVPTSLLISAQTSMKVE